MLVVLASSHIFLLSKVPFHSSNKYAYTDHISFYSVLLEHHHNSEDLDIVNIIRKLHQQMCPFSIQVNVGLEEIHDKSKTIFIACEEDMEEALLAVRSGIRTFSSDWIMTCVMKQELDLDAPQFAESL